MDPLCGPVAAKPLVLELLCLEVGTSAASTLTAETGFEIMKCICGVDMRGRVRMGSKSQILRFFNSGYAHDRNVCYNFSTSGIDSNWEDVNFADYAGVRQSRDSLHRAIHNAAPCSETAGDKKLKNYRETCFWHTTMPVNLVQID